MVPHLIKIIKIYYPRGIGLSAAHERIPQIPYTSDMDKPLFAAGKDFPAGAVYASAAYDSGRRTCITAAAEKTEDHEQEAGPVRDALRVIQWHRSSPLSARAVVLETENTFGKIDEALLIFDEAAYRPQFPHFDTVSAALAADEMITGYMLLAAELAGRLSKQDGGSLIFLFKKYTPDASAGGGKDEPTNVPVSAAARAFCALGESTAAAYGAFRTVLVREDSGMSDQDICAWLYPFLDTLPKKTSAHWYKAGSKTGSVLSIFKG